MNSNLNDFRCCSASMVESTHEHTMPPRLQFHFESFNDNNSGTLDQWPPEAALLSLISFICCCSQSPASWLCEAGNINVTVQIICSKGAVCSFSSAVCQKGTLSTFNGAALCDTPAITIVRVHTRSSHMKLFGADFFRYNAQEKFFIFYY